MRLRDVGEDGVVSEVLGLLSSGGWPCGELEVDDDAQCVPGLEGVLAKIDGYGFSSALLPWMTLYDLGWKAVAGVASDLYAKGARPRAFLVSVGVPGEMGVDGLLELIRGARDSAAAHGGLLLGGDTNRGEGWVDVAGVGVVVRIVPLRPRRRCGLVASTVGRYGLTGVAFHALERGVWREVLERYPRVGAETRRPLARSVFLDVLDALGDCVCAATDVSDGLAYSLYRLAEKARGAVVVERLPAEREAVEYAGEAGVGVEELVFYAGEEYEVVFLAEEGCRGDLEAFGGVEVLGRLEPGAGPAVVYRGRMLERRRWDQFAS